MLFCFFNSKSNIRRDFVSASMWPGGMTTNILKCKSKSMFSGYWPAASLKVQA